MKLNFEEHLKTIVYKINKTIGLLSVFMTKLTIPVSIKDWNHFTALPITGAIRGTSKEKLYNVLGLESLQNRRWYRKVSFLYKVIASQSPSYLFNMIPSENTSYPTRG